MKNATPRTHSKVLTTSSPSHTMFLVQESIFQTLCPLSVLGSQGIVVNVQSPSFLVRRCTFVFFVYFWPSLSKSLIIWQRYFVRFDWFWSDQRAYGLWLINYARAEPGVRSKQFPLTRVTVVFRKVKYHHNKILVNLKRSVFMEISKLQLWSILKLPYRS